MTTAKTAINLMKFQNYMAKLGYVLNVARVNKHNLGEIEFSFMPKDNDVKNLSSLIDNKDDMGLITLLNHVIKDYGLKEFRCYGRKEYLWVQEFKGI